MDRDQIKILVAEIKKKYEYGKRLSPWEMSFVQNMDYNSSKYGYVFTTKQAKILQQIYRKVWEDPWMN